MRYIKYRKELKNIKGPINSNELPRMKIDINGIINYARSKGKRVSELDAEEQNRFITWY